MEPTHRHVEVPGGTIHVAEQGEGPLVLLVHGFPDSWRSWDAQLPALAEAGFRAAAIDLRGTGASAPLADVADARMLRHVADDVAVVRALGASSAAVVGHDWGSPIAAASALLRPDVFTAVALLGVPYAPPGGPRPTEAFAAAGGEEELYVSYFQEPGRAEAEIAPDPRGWLAGFHAALEADRAEVFGIPRGGRMRDRFPEPAVLPAWLAAEELDDLAASWAHDGGAGALARYRNVDRDWEDLVAWEGLPLRQPSLYVAGDRDATTTWMAGAIAAHATTLPGLRGSHVLPGAGHWVHRERPAEVNALLLDWLAR